MNTRIHYWKHYLLMFTCVMTFRNMAALAQTYVSAPLAQANTTGEIYSQTSITLSPGFSANGAIGNFHAFISNTLPVPPSFSGDQNYVSQWIPQVAVKTADNLKALEGFNDHVSINVQYIDELGRTMQTVQKSSTPNGADLVQTYEYDEQSRQVKTYLPYVAGDGLIGVFHQNAAAAQLGFYANGSTVIAQTNTPYSKILIEASPMQQVVEQGGVGDPWQLTGDASPNSGHTSKYEYSGNNSVDINDHTNTRMAMLYGADIDVYGNRTLTCSTNYAESDLYVKVKKDVNWTAADGRAGTEEIYTDKSGHTVLKRSFGKDAVGGISMLSTYFVYDDFGKLCFVLPPGADADHPNLSGSQPITTDILNKFCYQYLYDQKLRLAAERKSGKDWDYMVYDAAGRTVATQDGNQRTRNEWSINKFDALGRNIITAIWNNGNAAIPRNDLQYIMDNQYGAASLFETRGTDAHGYTNQAWPQNINQYYSISYYDDYNIDGLPAAYNYQTYAGNPAGPSQRITGFTTATKTWPLSNNSLALWSVNYYDERGNTIQSIHVNHLSGTDLFNKEYNAFTGQLNKIVRQHATSAATVSITSRYVYDHHGRELQKYEQVNAGPEVLLSQSAYNELGQLIDKKLHQKGGNTKFIQSIDYRYNIHGRLTSINDPALAANSTLNQDDGSSDDDKFGMQVSYEQAAISQYNNNIGAITWKAAAPAGSGLTAAQYGYDFRYDRFNRLTEAVSSLNGVKNKYFDEYISYDDRGNIQRLGRWAKLSAGRVQADSLTYQYNGDRLRSVEDQTGNNTYGFTELAHQADEYQYDANGNVTQDLNKGISQITYNNFDKPVTVTWADGRTITYDYDGSGNKIKKVFNTGSTLLTTDYLNGVQYEQGQLAFMTTSEGIIRRDAGGNYYYQYALTDNLGNTRVMLQPDAATETIANVIQVSGYYPFGLEMQSDDPTTLISYLNGDKNNYLYNGKEAQDGINEYDYGARLYDPAIGRWSVVDALSADPRQISRSPYAYGWNNPVVHIDPDGNCPWCAVIGAVIGGVGNLVIHAVQGKIHNFNDGLKAFGIGAVAGAVAGATFNPALAEATAAGLTAAESGFIAGAFSSVASTAVEGPLNMLAFNDPYSLRDLVNSAVIGGVTAGILQSATTNSRAITEQLEAVSPSPNIEESPSFTKGDVEPVDLAATSGGMTSATGIDMSDARWSQNSFGQAFSTKAGAPDLFRNQPIDNIANGLRQGSILPNEVPVQVVYRDGNLLIVNTRSSVSLIRAGIPVSSWNVIDATGEAAVERSVTQHLGQSASEGFKTLTERGTFNILTWPPR